MVKWVEVNDDDDEKIIEEESGFFKMECETRRSLRGKERVSRPFSNAKKAT